MDTKTALIIGATSAIAFAVARKLASQNYKLFLVGRNAERLECIQKDLQARSNCTVAIYHLDLNDIDRQKIMLETAQKFLGQIDITLIAQGTLPNQLECQEDVTKTLYHFNTNATSIIALLTLLSKLIYQPQKLGTIAVISSVAGDRGRKSNYIYGAAKAAVTAFTSGLRARLTSDNVNVLTIKPGFVDTPMTAHIQPKGLLWASPEKVADDILRSINKRSAVVYTPYFWRWIMAIIKHIPENIFKKISL